MRKIILLFPMLLFFYGCSDDPFKGMSEDEKIKRYEKIKIELLQRWTCNYFIEEVYEYKTDRNKRKLNVEKNIFLIIHSIFMAQEIIKKI